MNETMEIARIAGREQFQLFFGKVSDLVFLVCPESADLLAVNPAFRDRTGKSTGGSAAFLFADFSFSELALPDDENYSIETKIRGEENASFPIQLHLSRAYFHHQLVLLGVARELKGQEEDERLIAAELEKKALLNEVYHRVKNNLNIIVSLLSLQVKRVTEPSVRLLLLESKSRIFTLALLQQKLYASERISEVKAGEYLTSLAKTVISSFKVPGQQVHLHADTEDCWLDVDLLMPLGLITHELVANAVLHAFPAQGTGEISIQLKREPSGDYLFKVADTGIGFPAGKGLNDFTSLGSQLVLTLTKQLKTEVKLEEKREKGTGFYFKIKAP